MAGFGGNAIVFAGPEDLIGDRMGQQAVASPTDRSRLYQARLILALTPGLDEPLMVRRIEEAGGDPDLLFRDDP